ncbi:MAG: hypothetical protein ACYCXW_24440, partial [Solirubrobacteraceae bacterium]
MAVELARRELPALSVSDAVVARLRAALDLEALIDVGWDPARKVFAPSADHPIFGFAECVVPDCQWVAAEEGGLCGLCARRWRVRRSRGMSFEEFVVMPRVLLELGRKRQVLCRVCCVAGFERPAASAVGLCLVCAAAFRRSGVGSVDEWIVGGQPIPGASAPRPAARPRPTVGRCQRCGRLACHHHPLSCQPCRFRWRTLGRPDWDVWCREHPVRDAVDGRVMVLAPASERLRLEFLIGVQDAAAGELQFNAWGELTRLAVRLTGMGVGSVLDVDESPIGSSPARLLLARIQRSVQQVLFDPEAELAGDVWRLGLLRRDGGRQRLDLREITQPWLREIYRDWAREALAVRNVNYLRGVFCQIRRVSDSLRTRPDRGIDRTAVGRRDIEQFLMRLAGLASAGTIANKTHVDCVIMVRCLVRRARDRGLSAPGGVLDGLSDTFAVYESDTPQKEERDPDDEVGRSLPNSVIKQLASPQALAVLTEVADEDVADVVELLIRTGRRPAEICHLAASCLQWDERLREDGTVDRQPVLVYRPEKTPKRSKRLPVHAREALIIERAADRARSRFPDLAA